ncbi:MAG: hypothetical protein GXP53_13700 [Deltaproteobacteria bacterium]|nr:hypothetical protein [Deltaproteobacteria bacterium]
MPVFSYIAYPSKGISKEQLVRDLSAMNHCEVMAAENNDVLILVTDTRGEDQEKALQKKLKNLKSLESLAMAYGHTDQ